MPNPAPITENNFNPQLTTIDQICSDPVFKMRMSLRDAEKFLRSTNSDIPISKVSMQLTTLNEHSEKNN